MVKVSVVMPVYNAEDYLEESIKGILKQSLKDIELICVDDGSVDSSLEILNKFAAKDKRVQVYHQENRGGGAARNVAITHAKGEYLYCMDADDIIDKHALKQLYKVATEKDVDFVIFQALNYDDELDKYYHDRFYDMNELADFVGEKIFNYEDLGELIFDMSVTPWCKLYNLEFVKKSGAQFAEGLIFHDNIFFWDILFEAKRIYFYRKFLYTRRRHIKSSTGAGDRRYLNYITICNMIWDIFRKHGMFYQYLRGLGIRKTNKVFHWYQYIQEEYKDEYFYAMKEDYEKIHEDKELFDKLYRELTDKGKMIMDATLKSETREEFDHNIVNLLLMEENEALRRQNEELKEEHMLLFNSTSWKITKPLRSFMRIFK